MVVPPLLPSANPIYANHAVMVNGPSIKQQYGIVIQDIAKSLGNNPNYNTVNSIVSGKVGKYIGVHRVFTALNVALGGNLHRMSEVYIFDQRSRESGTDAALSNCLVFPRLEQHLTTLNASRKQIGDEAAVRTIYVEFIVQGRPVAENLVRAVFGAVNRRLNKVLDEENELFS